MFVLALDISFETWAILAFAAVSVFGGLLKKKADSKRGPVAPRRPGDEAHPPGTPTRRAPTPSPPRPPRVPTSPREPTSARAPATVQPMPAGRPGTSTLPQPELQPAPPARAPTRPAQAPAIARRVTEAAPLKRRAPQVHPRKTTPPEKTRGLGPLEKHELGRVSDTVTVPKPIERRRASPAEKLDRVLLSRPGLQAAVMLSEILAPPLALRDNQGF